MMRHQLFGGDILVSCKFTSDLYGRLAIEWGKSLHLCCIAELEISFVFVCIDTVYELEVSISHGLFTALSINMKFELQSFALIQLVNMICHQFSTCMMADELHFHLKGVSSLRCLKRWQQLSI